MTKHQGYFIYPVPPQEGPVTTTPQQQQIHQHGMVMQQPGMAPLDSVIDPELINLVDSIVDAESRSLRSSSQEDRPDSTFLPPGTHYIRFFLDPNKTLFYGGYWYATRIPYVVIDEETKESKIIERYRTLWSPKESDPLAEFKDIIDWRDNCRSVEVVYGYVLETDASGDRWSPGNIYGIISSYKLKTALVSYLSEIGKSDKEAVARALTPTFPYYPMMVTNVPGQGGGVTVSLAVHKLNHNKPVPKELIDTTVPLEDCSFYKKEQDPVIIADFKRHFKEKYVDAVPEGAEYSSPEDGPPPVPAASPHIPVNLATTPPPAPVVPGAPVVPVAAALPTAPPVISAQPVAGVPQPAPVAPVPVPMVTTPPVPIAPVPQAAQPPVPVAYAPPPVPTAPPPPVTPGAPVAVAPSPPPPQVPDPVAQPPVPQPTPVPPAAVTPPPPTTRGEEPSADASGLYVCFKSHGSQPWCSAPCRIVDVCLSMTPPPTGG